MIDADVLATARDQAADLDQACKDCGDDWYNIPEPVRERMVQLMETLGVDLGGR